MRAGGPASRAHKRGLEAMRAVAAASFRWLKWGGLRHRCPVCERRFRRYAQDECPFCYANERTRELWAYLQRRDLSRSRVLHVAPELGLASAVAAARHGAGPSRPGTEDATTSTWAVAVGR